MKLDVLTAELKIPESATLYREERVKQWNKYVRKPASAYYYRRLAEIYRHFDPSAKPCARARMWSG